MKKDHTTPQDRRRPVLLIQHAPHEHPAALRRALESQGIQTLWIHPYRGEAYPKVGEIAGLISLGGPMGANDEQDHPWIKKECQLLRAAVEADLPVVGVCLGGQMLARAMGGHVERNEKMELGWFPIQLTPEGAEDPILGAAGKAPIVYHWHGDTFHLPEGATLLARSRACPRQAYRLSEKVYGFQFHPEADHQLVDEWLTTDGVPEEIAVARKSHGAKTVMPASQQLKRAMRCERAGLRITAGVGTLFRRRPPRALKRPKKTLINDLLTNRRTAVIRFEGSDRKPVHLRGHLLRTLKIPGAEFIIFREDTSLLWPVRLDDILEIHAVSAD